MTTHQKLKPCSNCSVPDSNSSSHLSHFIAVSCVAQQTTAKALPNIVIIYADDLGYGDLGCYGSQPSVTPRLDRLAQQGVRFTDFYSAQPVCSASRAALLTGCYPNRIGIAGALSPLQNYGLNHGEMTLAQLLKQKDYATAIFGKWHLGHHPDFLPATFGFDQYFGLPYSNDMSPLPANNPRPDAKKNYPPLPLIDGTKIVATEPDQSQLTTWYTERAVKFISDNHDRPFFLYVPHTMPHVPLYVSDKFAGKTGRGLYHDVLAEIDWSVGQILDALDQHKLVDRRCARLSCFLLITDPGNFSAITPDLRAHCENPRRPFTRAAFESPVSLAGRVASLKTRSFENRRS